MVTLRYGRDYRMEVDVKPNGKEEKRLVYVGPLFKYTDDTDTHKKQGIVLSGLGIIAVILFFSGFSFYSNLSRVWFTAVPYACNLLSLYYLIAACFYFVPFKETLNREQKEKGLEGFKKCSLASFILGVFSLVGGFTAIFIYLPGFVKQDIFFLIIVFLFTVTELFIFFFCRRITVCEVENPIAKEWELR